MTPRDDDRNSFVRGMTIGAIIGAIVAGSSLWSRRRNRRRLSSVETAVASKHEPSAPAPTDATDER